MSIYREIDLVPGHRRGFAFKGKGKPIPKVNIPDLAYPKELRQWHNNYPLAPDKTEIKGEMLSKYQLMIAEFKQ